MDNMNTVLKIMVGALGTVVIILVLMFLQSQTIETTATITNKNIIQFTCPHCDTVYDIVIKENES